MEVGEVEGAEVVGGVVVVVVPFGAGGEGIVEEVGIVGVESVDGVVVGADTVDAMVSRFVVDGRRQCFAIVFDS